MNERSRLSGKEKRWERLEWIGLAVLTMFTVAAIGGYGVFGRNPGLIPDSDSARRFYGLSFQLFARVHILLAAVILAIPLLRRARGNWIPALVAVYGVSFLSEFIGTGYGIPFGGYEYTGLLGFKLGDRVPAVIPLSWFLMAVPSWAVAGFVFRGPSRRIQRMLMGAYLLTAWDLALDPAMSYLTPYWVWEDTGPFYGMPWVNLAGWMGTGLVLMGIMEALGGRRWLEPIPVRWLLAYYGVILLMPLGMVAVAGLWWAVLATAATLGLAWFTWFLVVRARRVPTLNPALAQSGGGA